VSDDLLEKKKAKELAGKVRDAIEGAGGDGNVEVKVNSQRLVSVDSGLTDGQTEYLVTNLTFSEFETAMANKKQAAAEDLAVTSNEANAEASQGELKPTVPNGVPETSNDVQLPEEGQTQEPATVKEEPAHKEEEHQAIVEEKRTHKEEEEAVVEEKPDHQEEITVEHIALKKKPSALLVPVATILEQEIGLGPKTAPLPVSPGFSRNSLLANLEAQHRRETLKKYGPRKIAFGTKPLESIPQTC